VLGFGRRRQLDALRLRELAHLRELLAVVVHHLLGELLHVRVRRLLRRELACFDLGEVGLGKGFQVARVRALRVGERGKRHRQRERTCDQCRVLHGRLSRV